MLNLSRFIICIILSCVSLYSQASIITTPLPESSFITYNGIDWAWASPVSIQFDQCNASINNSEAYLTSVMDDPNISCVNQLLAPSFHDGWDFFDGTREQLLAAMPDLSLFEDNNGGYINAFDYWNTGYSFSNTGGINPFFVELGYVVSDWTTDAWIADINNVFYYNVLYVRTHQDVQSVPEPTTLLIFSLGLIALVTRKKMRK